MRWKIIATLITVFSAYLPFSYSQVKTSAEEIYVFFNVPVYGGIDIPAVLKGSELFLPVTIIFDFLKINQQVKPGMDTITGFFLRENNPYIIDRLHHTIQLGDQIFKPDENDFMRTESNLFLQIDIYGKYFGLECTFDFITLTVTLNTRLELPFIKELRQEQMRKNISRSKGEIQADSILCQTKKWLHLGAIDWSVMARNQQGNAPDLRLNLGLGGTIATGSASVSLKYSTGEPFNYKQQYYLWHLADNQYKVVKQVFAGKLAVNPVSTLHDPFLGIMLTNTPTGFRRSFCTYTLSDYTEPGWIVELYVNHMLIDFVKADASGFFTFEVPLTYGNTQVLLRFYGPWGEERTRQQYITIPYFFLPPGKFEYAVTTGILEDNLSTRFGRAVLNYGINRWVSASAGLEYMLSAEVDNFMPFASISCRIAPTLLFTGEYVHGVKSSGLLSYRLPGDLLIEMNYLNYVPGQTAISTNFLAERKFSISKPFRSKNFAAYFRFLVNQTVLPSFQNTSGELLISGIWAGVSFNATTFALLSKQVDPIIYSTLALGFRLPGGLNLTPQMQFEYTSSRFVSLKAELEKRIGTQGSLGISYEQNYYSNLSNLMATFRYNLPFAQTNLNTMITNGKPGSNEAFSGSLLIDHATGYFKVKNRSSVGRGGIVILPFLDLNYNGRHEQREPRAFGLSLKSNNGVIEQDRNDTLIRISDLEPYTPYLLELNSSGFENVAWRIVKSTLQVTVVPNQFQLVEVPIQVVGEVNGKVICDSDSTTSHGKGRILVCIYNSESRLVARTLSEPDGYFSYMGLKPGEYSLTFDQNQLIKSKLTRVTESIKFSIRPDMNGDISEGHQMYLVSEKGGQE